MYLRITHDYIDWYIGTSRERVTKTLKKFSEKNLIQKTKGCIEIKNIEKLRQLAFFRIVSGMICYRIVQKTYTVNA